MKYILLLVSLLCISCSGALLEQELAVAKDKLLEAEERIKALEKNTDSSGDLVHIVLFDLKADIDQNVFTSEIKKLEEIEEIQDLDYGPFKNLNDKRALSAYEFIMEMSFESPEDYKVYQTHPLHLALREKTNSLMAGPPATYDYMRK